MRKILRSFLIFSRLVFVVGTLLIDASAELSSSKSGDGNFIHNDTGAALAPSLCLAQSQSTQSISSVASVIDYEAESTSNRLISSSIQSCSICSGQRKVTQIGFGGELIFRSVTSERGGSTLIVFHYLTDRLRFAQIMINDRSPAMNLTFPTLSSRKYVATLPVLVHLCQGLNSIRIFNPSDDAPEFDRIQVY